MLRWRAFIVLYGITLALVVLAYYLGAALPDRWGNVAYINNVRGNHEIFLEDISRHMRVQLTDHPRADFDFDWSPDGKRIVFTSDRGQINGTRVYLMDLIGGVRIRRLTTLDGDELRPRWSPDGKHVALLYRDGGTSLLLIDPDTGDIVSRYSEQIGQPYPVWTADSQYLSYVVLSLKDNAYPIQQLNLITSAVEGIGASSYPSVDLAYSSDGRYLAFLDVYDNTVEITLRNLFTDEMRRLTESTQAELELTWLPNSNSLAFRYADDPVSLMRVIDLDTEHHYEVRLMGRIMNPKWQP